MDMLCYVYLEKNPKIPKCLVITEAREKINTDLEFMKFIDVEFTIFT